MKAPKITEMSIVPMLATVLEGQIPESSGPSEPIKPGEKQRGIITSPVARRLAMASSIFAEHIVGLIDEHKRLHEGGDKSTIHNCKAFRNEVFRLCTRKDILHGLLWQSIAEEYPQVSANNAGIRKGWWLVGNDGKWHDLVPVTDRLALANNFISRITAIVCRRHVAVKEEGLRPVAQGEEVVGSLNDQRVQTFWSTIPEIMNEQFRQLPSGVMDPDSKVIDDMEIDEANHLHLQLMHYKKLSDLTASLFWCGVRDAVPVAAEFPEIGIRKAWSVVKCVSDADEQSMKMVMTPTGPAIEIEIQIPSELIELLARRPRTNGNN